MMDFGQTLGPIITGFVLAISFQYSALFFSLSLVMIVSTFIVILLKIGEKTSRADIGA